MYVSIKVKAGFKREKGNSLKEEEIAIKGKRRGGEGERGREREREREGEGERKGERGGGREREGGKEKVQGGREGGREREKERKILRQTHTYTHAAIKEVQGGREERATAETISSLVIFSLQLLTCWH